MKLMTSTAPTGTEAGRAKRREEARLLAQKEMLEAQRRRRLRAKRPIAERVEEASKKLAGLNVGNTVALLETFSLDQLEVYLIAEIHGQNRKGVLSQFTTPRREIHDEYLRAVNQGPDSPDEEG